MASSLNDGCEFSRETRETVKLSMNLSPVVGPFEERRLFDHWMIKLPVISLVSFSLYLSTISGFTASQTKLAGCPSAVDQALNCQVYHSRSNSRVCLRMLHLTIKISLINLPNNYCAFVMHCTRTD